MTRLPDHARTSMEFVFEAPGGTLFIVADLRDRQEGPPRRLSLSRPELEAVVQVLKAHLAQAERSGSASRALRKHEA